MARLGQPRRHLRTVDSTNRLARELAERGAPHGTMVTASEQSSGRGRQGRVWTAPPGSAVLMSLVIREPSAILSLAAGVAVAETVDAATESRSRALIKWPNDVLVDARKVAGILVEGRPQANWAVLGIGLNVAVEEREFPAELAGRAGSLGLDRDRIEPVVQTLLRHIDGVLGAGISEVLERLTDRDYLLGRQISWVEGAQRRSGIAAGVDGAGRLIVELSQGGAVALDAGEVHIGSGSSAPEPSRR